MRKTSAHQHSSTAAQQLKRRAASFLAIISMTAAVAGCGGALPAGIAEQAVVEPSVIRTEIDVGIVFVDRESYLCLSPEQLSLAKDFGEVRRFLDKLEEGYDLVMGNRFAGGIMPGAMPWHHRYIGNPVLSGLGRVLYRTHIRDWHCGLRAFDRRSIPGLQLESDGMELASEMVLRASQEKLRVAEIPVTLYPDGRSRPPHLRSCRDGLRHLWLMVALSISR